MYLFFLPKGTKQGMTSPTILSTTELVPGTFALTPDVLEENVLASIVTLTSSNKRMEAQLYKINDYTAEGFFKSHCNTPKLNKHIGTVVVGLPSAFQGGPCV